MRNLGALGPAKLGALGAVAAVLLGFLYFMAVRLGTPNMGLLYSDIDLKDSSEIVAKLEQANVPYQLRGDGSQILVPSDQVARLRMTMAEAGLPRGGSLGYELFDKGESLGTSSFVQNLNHVRALEGEIGRSISALRQVQSARVHLVLPERQMFSREKQEPTASIILKLRPNDPLNKGQVLAIQQLTASAVPGLKPERVSIIDQAGTLLARGNESSDGGAENADDRRATYEQRLSRTVEDMLSRTVGLGRVRAQVNADMDFDRVTTSSETYDPSGQVLRSNQNTNETSDNADGGDQPVTVANNLPDGQAAQQAAGGNRAKANKTEETNNYEISKVVRSQVKEVGGIRRLSVAVMVDGTYSTDANHAYQPRSDEELGRLTSLVKTAIGYDEKRGDTVQVLNLRFVTPDEPAAVPSGLPLGLEKADLMRLAEIGVLGLVAILVIFLVLRPMMGRVFAKAEPAGMTDPTRLITDQSILPPALPSPAMVANGTAALASGLDGDGTNLPVPSGSGGSMDVASEIEQLIDLNQVEGRVRASSMAKIGEIVQAHPDAAVSIIRNWMAAGA